MKIIHVIGSLAAETGGPAKAVVEMAASVARRGHDVEIYATDFGDQPVALTSAEAAGVDVQIFPVQMPRFWKRSRPLKRALTTAIPQADVVHIHSLYLYHSWAAAEICRRFDVPYIIRPHGTLDPYIYRRRRWRKIFMELLFQNRALRGAMAIHYTTEEECRLGSPYVFGTPGRVVAIGVNFSDYIELPEAGALRTKYPEIGDRQIVLFLGRLNFKKGLDILIPAFAEAVRAVENLHLVIAGPDDGMEKKARAWVAEHRITDKTTFTGMLTGADILGAYRDAAVFVLPSYSENFGIAAVEAMACGVPVLISDKVNIWREVADAGAGHVAPTDAGAFEKLLCEVMNDDDARAAMGKAGVALACERFDWSNIAAELERLYESACASKKLSRPRSREK